MMGASLNNLAIFVASHRPETEAAEKFRNVICAKSMPKRPVDPSIEGQPTRRRGPRLRIRYQLTPQSTTLDAMAALSECGCKDTRISLNIEAIKHVIHHACSTLTFHGARSQIFVVCSSVVRLRCRCIASDDDMLEPSVSDETLSSVEEGDHRRIDAVEMEHR
jgi:hypothetical protein